MFSINQLQVFIAIVNTQSFKEAAKFLKITNSSVSKSLKALEDLLQVLLIKRDGKNIKLTEVGHVFYNQAQEIMKKISETNLIVEEMRLKPSGNLKIVSGHYLTKMTLLPYLKEFAKKYPKIKLDIENSERLPNIKNTQR